MKRRTYREILKGCGEKKLVFVWVKKGREKKKEEGGKSVNDPLKER
jgi:hypothetical protein